MMFLSAYNYFCPQRVVLVLGRTVPPVLSDLSIVRSIWCGGSAVGVRLLRQRESCFPGSFHAYRPFRGQYMIRFTPWTIAEQKADVLNDFPKHVYSLTPFSDLSTRVGSQECFIDVVTQVVGVSKIDYLRTHPILRKGSFALKDARNVEIKLVLWGERAEEFDAQLVYDAGQESAVIGVFVGLLMKSYNSEDTLAVALLAGGI